MPDHTPAPADQSPVYQIRVRGRLDRHWSDWFEGMQIVHQADNTTLPAGPVTDQAALHWVAAQDPRPGTDALAGTARVCRTRALTLVALYVSVCAFYVTMPVIAWVTR